MSTNPKARAWVQVRADALRSNYGRIREAVPDDARILPMVKADAYGLGVREVVGCLEPLDPWGFGVATVQEGVQLRQLGVRRPVVVCSPTPTAEFSSALEHDLQLSVSSIPALDTLEECAAEAGRVASFHVDVDTGMGRSGFDWRQSDTWMPRVAQHTAATSWVGCYTHLHSADEGDASLRQQAARFDEVLGRPELPQDVLVHILNSAGAFRAPQQARALVRPGIFLYGGAIGDGQPEPESVASVHARVVYIREVTAGTTLGYGSTYTAATNERWATLSIGYGDGLPRALGNRGSALVGGHQVPIVGRISMDVTVVDITGQPDVEEGAVATLLGTDGTSSISVDDVAALAGTISYEVLTGLTSRLPRVWSESG